MYYFNYLNANIKLPVLTPELNFNLDVKLGTANSQMVLDV